MKVRVGFGYDVHQLMEGRELWLGGVRIDYERGLEGHSDADVLVHAICDALLGAADLRDIGHHFPDAKAEYENAASTALLRETVRLLKEHGYSVGNIDATICAEQPKLSPFIPTMKEKLAEAMGVDSSTISIKATTSEKIGFVGREEGMVAYAVALIHK